MFLRFSLWNTLTLLPNLTSLDLYPEHLDELQDPTPMENITHLTLEGETLEVSQKLETKKKKTF